MHNKITQASAPGKLILLGEYAVLEKAPCLVSAVKRRCTIQIKGQHGNSFRIESSRTSVPSAEFTLNDEGKIHFRTALSDDELKSLRFVLCTIKHVTGKLGRSLSGATIHINTDRFFHKPSAQKLGLGASAAITVSLLDALTAYSGKALVDQELYREAYQIHREAQGGVGSGMDIAASAAGGVIQYQLQKDIREGGVIQPVSWPGGLHMLSIWAGQSASTQNMVQQVQAFREARPSRYNALMEPMKKLSGAGCRAFRSGDTEGFMEIISEFARHEERLGEASEADIISEAHKDIGAIVNKAGGVYKPSGAGGGDIGVAFCGDAESFHAIKKAVGESRFDVLDLPLQTDHVAAEPDTVS